ncbi:MAG: cystathionine gamma-synthase, partial [Actinomycetota bacterium]|nr:cystathionine gamma-synthase [Actinomycetota bacterium]
MTKQGPGFETLAVHAGQDPDPATGAVVPPLHLATTYAQEGVGRHKGYEYSRTGNPTRATLETTLATLEGAEHGVAFASGMAAEDAVLRSLSPGEHLVVGDDVYGGTWRLIARVLERYGIEHSAVDLRDRDALSDAWTSATRLVWIETPTNPLLRIVDIEGVCELAHRRGGRVVVDNTFATPYLQQPIRFGADVVVHSATKYLGGHSDVVGGAALTDDKEMAAHLRFIQNAAGAVPSPFDCYLVQRGLKTLAVRMDRQCASAMAVAEFLAAHPAVASVRYPGLSSDEGHALAARQMRAFGAMVSFTLEGGEQQALEVAARTGVFTLAESLGAVESLIEHPARMTHLSVAGSLLEVDPSLLRLSVGLET